MLRLLVAIAVLLAASASGAAPPSPPASARPSVLLLGIDGATWDVIDPLMAAGRLPNLARLVREGARGTLDCAPAMPETACFCAPVWTSMLTGVPYARHRIATPHQESGYREAPALWDVLHADRGSATLVSLRNTWPPETSARYVLTEYGLDWAASELYEILPPKRPLLREQLPDLGIRPPTLLEDLGVMPADPERGSPQTPGAPGTPGTPVWKFVGRDRIAMRSLLRLASRDRTDLTAIVLHAPQQAQRLGWKAVQPTPGAPFDRDALLVQARAWKGPVTARGPRSPGTDVASQYLETDVWLGELLAAVSYDRIVVASDHGMARNPAGKGLPGAHGPEVPQAHQGVLILWGDGIRPGATLEPASVFDLAPTLAHLLALPVAEDLPGRVLEQAFTDSFRESHPIESVPTWKK